MTCRFASSRQRPRFHRQGMTLVEVLIVVTLLALAAAGTTLAIGALTRTNLRSACMNILAASHYSYNRAIVRNRTVRIRIDADQHTMALEEAHDDVTIAGAEDATREAMNEREEDQAAVDPWEAARARLEKTMEPTFGRSPFHPLKGPEGETIDKYKAQPIGDEIRVVRMYLPHEPEPVEQGEGSIYFFSSGRTEHAVVQLTGPDRETVYSVEIHPLTGRGEVHDEAYEPRDLEAELGEGGSEMEDRL